MIVSFPNTKQEHWVMLWKEDRRPMREAKELFELGTGGSADEIMQKAVLHARGNPFWVQRLRGGRLYAVPLHLTMTVDQAATGGL